MGFRALGLVAGVFSGAVLSGASLASAQDAEPNPQNLEALLQAAESHWPALQADEFALAAAEAQLGEARFSPYFRWNVTFGASVVPDSSGTPIFSDQGQLAFDGWGPALGVDFRGGIPVYTFGKLQGLRRAARAGVAAATVQRERTLAQLRFDVRRAYYGLQLALDVQQMIGEGRNQLARAVSRLEELIEEGDSSVNPIDRRRLAAALAEIDARASETQRLRESSEAALRVLTGQDAVRVPDCPMALAPVPEQDGASAVETAAEERPEAQLLDAAVDARQAAVTIARGGYAPDLALAFRAGITWTPGRTDQNNPWIQDPANQPTLSAGVVLRWNLDIAGNVFRTRRAEAQLAQTRAQAEAANASISLEAEIAVSRIEDARRREAAWDTGERETRAWFIGLAQAYDVGAAEPRDLIDALKGYFEARFSHLQARMDFNVAAANLERMTGQPVIPMSDWEPACD